MKKTKNLTIGVAILLLCIFTTVALGTTRVIDKNLFMGLFMSLLMISIVYGSYVIRILITNSILEGKRGERRLKKYYEEGYTHVSEYNEYQIF